MPGTDRRNSCSSDDSNPPPPVRQFSQDGSEIIPTRMPKVTAPKPAANPLQFIKVGPCDLYKAAQEQIKKVEEIKKVEKVTHESEDWQSNLDNWKCSRRKRQEHIIERVVEVKKLEMEEHDRNRKRSKTFSEMMEERTSKGGGLRKMSLLAYPDEDSNDLSDLGIGLSNKESETKETNGLDNSEFHEDNGNSNNGLNNMNGSNGHRSISEYESSTSATTSSPEPEEYTYERAIQGYMNFAETKMKTPIKNMNERKGLNGSARISPPKKETSSKIGEKLSELEQVRRRSESVGDIADKQLPKVDIHKRRSMFENSEMTENNSKSVERVVKDLPSTKSIKERLSSLEKTNSENTSKVRAESEVTITVKERLTDLERQKSSENLSGKRLSNGEVSPQVSIKERLCSLEKQVEPEGRHTRSPSTDVSLSVSIKERVSNLGSACQKDATAKTTPERDSTFRDKLETFKSTEKSQNDIVNNRSCSEETEKKMFHRSLDTLETKKEGSSSNAFERVQSMEELEITGDVFVSQSFIQVEDVPLDVKRGQVSLEVEASVDKETEVLVEEECKDTNILVEAVEECVQAVGTNLVVVDAESKVTQEHDKTDDESEEKKESIKNEIVEDAQLLEKEVTQEIKEEETKKDITNISETVIDDEQKIMNSIPDEELQTKEETTEVKKEIQKEETSELEKESKQEETTEVKKESEQEETVVLKEEYTLNKEEAVKHVEQEVKTEETLTVAEEIKDVNGAEATKIIEQEEKGEAEIEVEQKLSKEIIEVEEMNKQNNEESEVTIEDILKTEKIEMGENNEEEKGSEEEEEDELQSLPATFQHYKPWSDALVRRKPRVRKLTPILTPPIQPLSPPVNMSQLHIIEEGDVLPPNQDGLLSCKLEHATLSAPKPNAVERLRSHNSKVFMQKRLRAPNFEEMDSEKIEDEIEQEDEEEGLYTDENIDEVLGKTDEEDGCADEMVTRFDLAVGDNSVQKTQEVEKPVPEVTDRITVLEAPVLPPNYENVIIQNQVPQVNMSSGDVEIVASLSFSLGGTPVEPPKEKPPPPPIELSDEESTPELPPKPSVRRLDSTKRIKKEIRKKRSDFLGIEGAVDDSYLEPEVYVSPPPDMITLLQEERRLEQQLYRQSICSESDSNHETAESRDSGVELDRGHVDDMCWSKQPLSPDVLSEPHSRQNSETFGNTSITSEEDEIMKKEREIIEVLEKEEQWRYGGNGNSSEENDIGEKLAVKLRQLEQEKMQLEWQRAEEEGRRQAEEVARREDEERLKAKEQALREQENSSNSNTESSNSQEALRSERERLLKEQEELERCRQNLLQQQKQQEQHHSSEGLNIRHSLHNPHWDTPSTRHSLQEAPLEASSQPLCSSYRFSMPDLQQRPPPPIPPAKPLRPLQEQWPARGSVDNLQTIEGPKLRHSGQMTRSTLHALSAAPRSRLISNENWMQPKRKADAPKGNYNYQHWLIQEAEHRRIIEQQQRATSQNAATRRSLPAANHAHPPSHHTVGLPSKWVSPPRRDSKPLPESVIQTITQRVQNMDSKSQPRRRLEMTPLTKSPSSNGLDMSPSQHPHSGAESQERMLSVSGKKKCSHCDQELGRGAAMIIESLRLFYHIDCFKCCVCHVQLGDGLIGTDVRVRNNKLHCHNCYSSDDGVKFSCV